MCVHKVPEGLALGALLLGAGFSRAGVIFRVAGVEATTLLGGVVGWLFLRHISAVWVELVVAQTRVGSAWLV